MHFAQFARSVTLIVRGDSLARGMSQYLVDQIEATPNISAVYNSNVTGVAGEGRLESITISNAATGESQTVPTHALLVFIGAQPHTEWVAGVLERDEVGFILTGMDLLKGGKRPAGWTLKRDPYWLESSVPGVLVAGDVRHMSVKRIASSVGEGSMAVQFVHQYLSGL
jgi:thioredoxin reductase (NADPH)